jgi:hypothetical protein
VAPLGFFDFGHCMMTFLGNWAHQAELAVARMVEIEDVVEKLLPHQPSCWFLSGWAFED